MYYLGFLKQNTKDVVIFKSLKKPKKGDYSYFVRVMGPYQSEGNARKGLIQLKKAYGEYGYKENPSQEERKVSVLAIRRMVALSKKVVKLYGQIRKKNPGNKYLQGFMSGMRALEKLTIGSKEYGEKLAEAYEHLKVVQAQMKK